MAISFGSQSTAVIQGSGSSQTMAFTTAGSDRFLLVGVLTQSNQTCSGVTYNGVAMTQIGSPQFYVAANENWSGWYLLNPAVGANNIVATFSGSCVSGICPAYYTGVGSVDSTHDASGNPITSLANTFTTTANNCWLTSICRAANTLSAGSNTTVREASSAVLACDTNAPQTPAGTYSLNLTSASNDFMGMHGVAIAPIGGGGGGLSAYRALQGVGI